MATNKPKVESLRGVMVIDYTKNRVDFRLQFENNVEFQLPLAPLDIDIARQTSKYAKTKKAGT